MLETQENKLAAQNKKKEVSGACCLGPFYVPDVKIWVKTAENEKSERSDKPLAAPIPSSEIVLLYALSNLTKRSVKSF